MGELTTKEFNFLKSALTADGMHTLDDFFAWYEARKHNNAFRVEQVPFSKLDQWSFNDDPLKLGHASGKFFSIEGLDVKTNSGQVQQWEQPIINQPEIGILGILTKKINGVLHFLMQAKMEPGNINILQMSPTVQATKSNYTKVHKGNAPTYLEFFTGLKDARILIDQLQSEQAARFWGKRNRNIIIEVEGDVYDHPDFFWLTLGQIKQLLEHENVVNMDARTVLACIPYFTDEDVLDFEEHEFPIDKVNDYSRKLLLSMSHKPSAKSFDSIVAWITDLRCNLELDVIRKPVDQLKDWTLTDESLSHDSGRFFSVIGVAVEAGNREVVKWTQPLLQHFGTGLCGFLTQERDGLLHFLVSARLEPGNRDIIELGPTVARSGVPEGQELMPSDYAEFFADRDDVNIIFDTVHSEEGGRFYHFQNRYMIVEVDKNTEIPDSPNYHWMNLAQVTRLIKFSMFNIEARNLLACLSLHRTE